MIQQKDPSTLEGTRSQLLEALIKLSELSPDWRFGQLVCNVTDYVGDDGGPPKVWDVTDKQLLTSAQALIRHRENSKTHPET